MKFEKRTGRHLSNHFTFRQFGQIFGVAALGLTSLAAHAFDAFVVKDIRIEGIQRTEAGTVFGYLPVRVLPKYVNARTGGIIATLYPSRNL